MDHSLINPNQSSSFGILVWGNPYDAQRPICIETGDLFIPFQTEGLTIFFDTHYTSDFELETCPHIVMNDEMEWNPKTLELPVSIRSTDEVSTEHFIHLVRRDRYKDLNRDYM